VRDQFRLLVQQHQMVIVIHHNGKKSTTTKFDNLIFSRSLKPDESPQLDPPSSFDILDFCYTILVGTFDLLRRLVVKDCLHICLQLNNSICEIIDLFVKHNYGLMNV
jgi:hypothetical protein